MKRKWPSELRFGLRGIVLVLNVEVIAAYGRFYLVMTEFNGSQSPELLEREAWKWVLHLTSGEATKGDIAALERWCGENARHAEAFAKASGAWRALGPAAEKTALLSGVVSANATSGAQRAPRLSRRAILAGAIIASSAGAAAFALTDPIGLWPSLTELTADYRTATGEQRRVELPGRLSIEMNTRTSLNIQPAGDQREHVQLIAGEAVITAKSQLVEVIAAEGLVLAQNAQFNVRRDGSSVCVTCLGGSVDVQHLYQKVRLRQNQQVLYGAAHIGTASSVDPSSIVGWQKGDIYFRDQPLAEVINEVNRYRPGWIVLMNHGLGQRRITAHFRLDHLGVIIAQLKETFGARVTFLPGGVVLVA